MSRSLQHMSTIATLALVASAVTGCASQTVNQVSSTILPGHPVVSFPNRQDRFGTTAFSSNSTAQEAGVNGRTLTITTFDLNKAADQLTIDIDGNLGLRGSFHSASSRGVKKDIRPFASDAVNLLEQTRIVTFRYRGEPHDGPVHVGIVAEEAPEPLTDAAHRSFDLNNSVAVTIAAERELNERIRKLEAEVTALKSVLSGGVRPHSYLNRSRGLVK